MSVELKILKFVGVDKKEQVLLKSFLNLAKDELEFDLQIDDAHASPNVIVVDEDHVQAGDAFTGVALKITIGNNSDDVSDRYMQRPLRWSRFKSVLDGLDAVQSQQPVENIQQQPAVKPSPEIQEIIKPEVKQTSAPEQQKIEPKEIKQPPQQPAQEPVQSQPIATKSIEQPQKQEVSPQIQPSVEKQIVKKQIVEELNEQEVVEFFPGEKEYEDAQFSENAGEWELEESVHAELSQVQKEVDEVSVAEDEVGQLYALNDDEIESPSEFLDNMEEMIIETDMVDQWEERSISIDASVSVSESSISQEKTKTPKLNNLLDKGQVKKENLIGEPLGDVVQFWSGDTEVLLNNHPVFIIREKRNTVYTEYEPHKWYKIFGAADMRQRKLDSKWKPYGRLESYPLDWLIWCAYVTRSKGVLSKAINKKDLFLLERWPDFSLVQNDNNLLKLCSLAFINPESPRSLVMQSKLRARDIVGFMNACHTMGLLSWKGNEDGDVPRKFANDDQGSMTWFKGLFK